MKVEKIEDINGWVEIKGNPLSKVGIFPYLGAQIDPNGQDPNIEPEKIYNIYRSEEELTNKECIESFKLLPWTDEHTLLGKREAGLTPAEEKGIQGVIGGDVYFESGYLKGNIKIFSEKLAQLIKLGKKELSIGYRCVYDMVSGIYEGKPYHGIQRKIRGNHLATVTEGRSGPDVAVQDNFKFTLDTNKGIIMPQEKEKTGEDELTLESLAEKIEKLTAIVEKVINKTDNEMEGEFEDEEEGRKEKLDDKREDRKEDRERELQREREKRDEKRDDRREDRKDGEDECGPKRGEDEYEGGRGMDEQIRQLVKKVGDLENSRKFTHKSVMAEISQRDKLVSKLSVHIGAFDHADLTINEVACYGVKKLKIDVPRGQELAGLSGFLAAQHAGNRTAAVALDHGYVSGHHTDPAIEAVLKNE